ncbi:mannose-1-phosphate guanylyltransferase [Treponema sp.]|uniref:mannose-1-phosphate guanylyltransferase n=1 Tax=Treponema sp. TaxID=166 RepID=UPI0025EF0141|nr:mannose-1-phosphate guanylyltransferase [Treponema sp.]
MASNFTDIVILAGGFGERLWPASKADFPKQFLSLQNGMSFLQSAVVRSLAVSPAGKILILTRQDILKEMTLQCAGLKKFVNEAQWEKICKDLIIIAEPCARHTAAPLLLASKYLKLSDPSFTHNILVLASDHIISPVEKFVADSKKAAEAAEKGNFVCFAIKPTEPSTGYGYIKMGQSMKELQNLSEDVYKIEQFKEKPDLETAKSYLASGKYCWNSGMFGFTADFFENEMALCEPDVANAFTDFTENNLPLEENMNGIKYISQWKAMEEAYKGVKSIAVDNAIAERTSKAVVVSADFGWDDVGSWDAFEKLFDKNENTVEVESKDNFVYSDIPVALCGVEGLTVVIKNGKALVLKKGSGSLMREVVKEVKEKLN